MSTRREHPTHTTGVHRAHRGTHRAAARPPVPVDPYRDHLDGLFTYCLSVMCEHEAAVSVLGEALAVAERQRRRGRTPADTALHRPWLYALARWSCLRLLAERQGVRPEPPELPGPLATARRRELAALAWPEAAGTGPEQREALELAVRHHLPVHEVAAVLGTDHDGTELLLSSAACEVERTRTALAVVDRGGCPAVARLAGDREVLLGSALRRELVRHVDECPECRRTAERVLAGGPWPGTAPADVGALTVLPAPRAEVHAAMLAAQRARAQHTPRFDRRGFPVNVRDRAERFDRLRSRAVTTTVVATVVAAPLLALWAAYRGAPLAEGGPGGAPVSASERQDPGGPYGGPRGDGSRTGGTGASRDGSGVRIDVAGADGGEGRDAPSSGTDGADGADGADGDGPRRGDTGTGPGRLTVEAQPSGDATVVTLVASGGSPVDWTASVDAPWLRLDRAHGTLRPGESAAFTVTVDRSREPAGAWTARISIAPAKAVITLRGHGAEAPAQPRPSEPPEPEPGPSEPPAPEPTPEPTSSTPPAESSPPPAGQPD
ncbi:BACON domain-containing protein [Streptomyces barkulensis]|uniref:BACON domain-containing protein n=1 Tax=Streptomyces barkulensis TaxID=1257026 RepID=UPI000C6E87A2|nr:sigma-70 family RNA polymerase sigma factor [Streptomyces barkulensis]